MRWRTRGSSANRTSSCTSRFPPSSAGCALPATTIWMGCSGCSRRSISRSRSRSIRVRRLYEGTRRAKPMVRTSGSRTPSIQPSSAVPAPRPRQDARGQPAHLVHQLLAQDPPQLPDVLVGDLPHRVPAVRAADGQRVLGALGADLPGAEPEDLGRDPGGRVHPVGHGGDRHLVGVESRPQAGEHLAADMAVQQGDAVGPLPEAQAHHGHVEEVRFAAGIGLHAQPQDALDVDAREFGCGAEVVGDQLAVEAVDAGRDGRVGGEDGPGADRLQRGVEVQPAVAELGDALQAQEGRRGPRWCGRPRERDGR